MAVTSVVITGDHIVNGEDHIGGREVGITQLLRIKVF